VVVVSGMDANGRMLSINSGRNIEEKGPVGGKKEKKIKNKVNALCYETLRTLL
jgi:hypothetical protein